MADKTRNQRLGLICFIFILLNYGATWEIVLHKALPKIHVHIMPDGRGTYILHMPMVREVFPPHPTRVAKDQLVPVTGEIKLEITHFYTFDAYRRYINLNECKLNQVSVIVCTNVKLFLNESAEYNRFIAKLVKFKTDSTDEPRMDMEILSRPYDAWFYRMVTLRTPTRDPSQLPLLVPSRVYKFKNLYLGWDKTTSLYYLYFSHHPHETGYSLYIMDDGKKYVPRCFMHYYHSCILDEIGRGKFKDREVQVLAYEIHGKKYAQMVPDPSKLEN